MRDPGRACEHRRAKKLSQNFLAVLQAVAASVQEQAAGELDEAEVLGGVLVVANQ
jgi:hypothetical protein